MVEVVSKGIIGPVAPIAVEHRRGILIAVVVLVIVGIGIQVSERWLLPANETAAVSAAVNRIPVPQTATIHPRELAGGFAFFLAAVFLVLYFYRRRTFILQWARGWFYLAITMVVQAAMDPVAPSRWSVAVSGMFAIASAFTLIKGAASLRNAEWNRRRHAILSGACLVWYVFARLFISQSAAFAISFVALAALLALASLDYLRLARERRWLGAAAIGVMLAIVGSANVVVAASVPKLVTADALARNLLLANMACYAGVAFGMFVLVFEEVAADLKTLAATDPLTGCFNRHHWDSVVRAELKRHDRFGLPLSVLFVDVDHFKAVNDTFGHAAGDRVLAHVARTLRSNIREFDVLCRWGGDEFVILMVCEEASAIQKSRQLQRVFIESLAGGGWPPSLGLSIGVAGVPAGTTDIGPCVRLADERMYANKLEQTQS